MSTPEQPDTPPLTRRQLREIRTGAIVTVPPDQPDAAPTEQNEPAFAAAVPMPARAADHAAPAAPLPRPATPVVVPPAPGPDASVDLGVSPLTRRQARQQERIRTASVPVVTPELASQYAAQSDTVHAEVEPADTDATSTDVLEPADAEVEDADVVELVAVKEDAVEQRADERDADEVGPDQEIADEASEEKPVVSAEFGAELLTGEPVRVELPPTFDQLISREASSGGSVATPNALILSQTPSAGPLTGPVAATGEVLITGSYDLPEGLGSTGHAPGTTDGKETDAVLVDGELPAHSSPTPISASAAISTVKTEGEIIRPPAPEKGNKLMLTLAITAGALALALVGVLILAFVTGVFS